MGDVYGNASITIAVSGAESVHDGLFKSSIPEPRRCPRRCQIPFDLPDGNIGTAQVCPETAVEDLNWLEEPLNMRAWAFQERLLSRRVVIYRQNQISWDCHTTSHNSRGQ
jgi:hypothetical protein